MPEERREQVTRVGIEQGQRVTGGTRRFRWKAAAFHGWHEPDKSRGLRPESVSGSGCKSPGRLGLGVKLPGPTRLVSGRRMKIRHAVRKMKEGPSEPPCRGRLQTAISCFGQKPRWWTLWLKGVIVSRRRVSVVLCER